MAVVAYTVVSFQPPHDGYDTPMLGRLTTVVIAMASFAAMVISFNLTLKHIHGTSGIGWFEAACSDDPTAAGMNCAKVLNSPYSYLPPRHDDQPGGFHLPVSFLGLIYFSGLFLWICAIGRPSFLRRKVHAIPLIVVGAGLAFSAWFIYLMYSRIGEWCPWCLATHVLNLIVAIGLVLLWPPKPAPSVPGEPTGVGPFHYPHPSNRLIATTLGATLLFGYGHLFFFEWRGKIRDNQQLMQQLNALRSNVGGFMAQWQMTPPCPLPLRDDEAIRTWPERTPSAPLLDVIVFSDFECPGCVRFAEFFEKRVLQLFGHNIRLVFRHNPWDQSCNPRSKRNLHPNACAAARLAEAARELSGPEAFWKAHDYLFEHRKEIASGTMSPDLLASALGLETTALANHAGSSQIATRIADDIESGTRCNVQATPTVFVDGRRVEGAAASNIEFWDRLADWYWSDKAKSERPLHTRIKSEPEKP